LQDSGWEPFETYDTCKEALFKAVRMIDGPLGTSCMYEIRSSDGKIVLDNKYIFAVAGYER
jgi:hypothetical protein